MMVTTPTITNPPTLLTSLALSPFSSTIHHKNEIRYSPKVNLAFVEILLPTQPPSHCLMTQFSKLTWAKKQIDACDFVTVAATAKTAADVVEAHLGEDL